eukprot:m.14949 g.14949  ORF g.14949 m.14949 type:complete len:69 (-) comp7789_c0_seq1:255-461(-)
MDAVKVRAQLDLKEENVEKEIAKCLPILEERLESINERMDNLERSVEEMKEVLKGAFLIGQKNQNHTA